MVEMVAEKVELVEAEGMVRKVEAGKVDLVVVKK